MASAETTASECCEAEQRGSSRLRDNTCDAESNEEGVAGRIEAEAGRREQAGGGAIDAAAKATGRRTSWPVHEIEVCLFPFPSIAALSHRAVRTQSTGQRDVR